jgi:2-dehydro-3-deoxy-D-arabinonate dehydratase
VTTGIWRVGSGEEVRLARGPAAKGPAELLAAGSLTELLVGPAGALERALTEPAAGPVPAGATVLCPIDAQEVWAAGVTYRRSRDARMEESGDPDHYDRVYVADRPELFPKAAPGRAVGPGENIGIRADSTWDVPEPELGLVADARGTVVAYVLGNDVSSRSIEGENPLYLPQAKVYAASCALGPCVVPVGEAPSLGELTVQLRVERGGAVLVDESVGLDQLNRAPEDLVGWLFRALAFPAGVVLLTGTGIVPPESFTLRPGDVVTVSGTELGMLRNTVVEVGR